MLKYSRFLTIRSNIAVAVLLISVIFMMVIPLPRFIVDSVIPAIIMIIILIIITRVQKILEPLPNQMRVIPIALVGGGAICFVFALIPGFPIVILLVSGVIAIATGVVLLRNSGKSLTDTNDDHGLVIKKEVKKTGCEGGSSSDVE